MTWKVYRKDGKGEQSIYIRPTLDASHRFKVFTGIKVLSSDWDYTGQYVKRSDPHHLAKNRRIQEQIKRLRDLWFDGPTEKPWAEYRALALGTTDEKKSQFFPALDKFIEIYKQDKSPLTPKNYEALRTHLEEMSEVSFEGMDFNFLDEFRHTLRKLEVSTVNKYVARLKTFLSWATDRGYPVNQIYRKWKIVKRVKEPFAVTWQQLTQLDKAELTGHAAIGRKAFMIQAGTGARISDAKKFKASDIIYTMNGPLLSYWRKKNQLQRAKKVNVPLNTPVGELAIKYLDNGAFPDYAEQKLNEWIKEAFEVAKIQLRHKVHNHIGRKTFITLALHCLPPELVMDATGLDSHQTIRNYKAKTDLALMQQQFAMMEAIKMKVG